MSFWEWVHLTAGLLVLALFLLATLGLPVAFFFDRSLDDK